MKAYNMYHFENDLKIIHVLACINQIIVHNYNSFLFLKKIEVQLIYILVSGIQHSDSIFFFDTL